MGNKKGIFCVVMFLVILIFGIVGPNLKDRDKYIEDKYVTTTENTMIADNATEATTEAVATKLDAATGQDAKKEYVDIEYDPDNKYYLSRDIENKIGKLVSEMSLEDKVGQMFFVKNDGRFDESVLEKYPVGGIILFKGDFSGKTESDIRDNISKFQDASDIGLFVGTDEEGGSVVRLSEYSYLVPEKFKSPSELYYEGGFEAIEQDTINKSEILLSYGINVNFAPVGDIPDSSADFIYNRAISTDLNTTINYVGLVVSTMRECRIGAVLKHFPGYGNNADTHNGPVIDNRSLEEFDSVDVIPFRAGVDAGIWCILVNHTTVTCMDSENPASLSEKVHTRLRDEYKFDGVIITDDLMMGAISDKYSVGDAAVQAVVAGNDMLLSTDYQVQYAVVLEAVKSGKITEERIDDSVKRILRWKYTLGLLEL